MQGGAGSTRSGHHTTLHEGRVSTETRPFCFVFGSWAGSGAQAVERERVHPSSSAWAALNRVASRGAKALKWMTYMTPRVLVMDATALRLAVRRIAHQIAERNADASRLLVLGVQKGGVHLAQRLAHELSDLLGRRVPHGQLDVSMHRDDLHQRPPPTIQPTNLPGDVNGATVILVDEVLHSGRTARAALDALHDYGRPGIVQLAVLIDRPTHRQLPIQAEYVARKLDTAVGQRVDVRWAEDGGDDCAYLETP